MSVLPGWNKSMVARSSCLQDLHCGYLFAVDWLVVLFNVRRLDGVGHDKLRRHSFRLPCGDVHCRLDVRFLRFGFLLGCIGQLMHELRRWNLLDRRIFELLCM